MLVVDDSTKEAFLAATKEALEAGLIDNFLANLRKLSEFGLSDDMAKDQIRCTLYHDFAPFSFSFVIERKAADSDTYESWFNGGLIYHGRHDGYGSGSAPTFSVSLTPSTGWQIHT